MPPTFQQEWRYDPNAKVGTLSLRRLFIGDEAYNKDAREALMEAQKGLEEAQREIEEAGVPENEVEEFARQTQRKAIEVSKAAIQKSLDELHADSVK